MKTNVMKTNVVFCALLLAASVGFCQTVSKCPAGLYRSADGNCVGDQTGDQFPAGDGCNVVTCQDPQCNNRTTTTYLCSTVDPSTIKMKHNAVQNLNLSSYFPGVNVFVYPEGNKMMVGFDKKGKVEFTVYRDGRIVVGQAEQK